MNRVKTARPKLKDEHIQVELNFDEVLTSDQLTLIILELVKSLLYQRRQIPLTLDSLRRDVSSQSLCSLNEEPIINDGDLLTRKQLRANARKAKLREKFLKKAAVCVSDFDSFEATVSQVVAKFHVEQVALILGLSPACPKEIYLIDLPPYEVTREHHAIPSSIDKRKLLRIFRVVMGHEKLFDRISEEFPLTNAHLAFKTRLNRECDVLLPDALMSRPDLKNKAWPQRAKVTSFLVQAEQCEEVPYKKRATVSGNDSYTPLAMELCTPYIGRYPSKRSRHPSEKSLSECMVETPCQRSSTFKSLENGFHHMSVDDETCQDEIWLYCIKTLKGFRDPQVQSSDD